MNELAIKTFVDGASRYFAQSADKVVKIGTPFLIDNAKPTVFDFTGVIQVSGVFEGVVYFTAPRILLTHLLMSLGEYDTSNDNILDIAGEVANTLAGNARSEFGSDFRISVPSLLDSTSETLSLPSGKRSYSIPIYWRSYSAAVVVCLQ
jgi:chemotaxis protein CheX